jgi:prophage regulatory protein
MSNKEEADPITQEKGLRIMHRILRLPDVKTITGLSRSTIYFRISQGCFPESVSLGGRAAGWLEHEVQDWLQAQILASRACKPALRTSSG